MIELLSCFQCFHCMKDVVICTEAETHIQKFNQLNLLSVCLNLWSNCSKSHYFVCNFVEFIVAFYRNCNNARRPRQKQNLKSSVVQESNGELNRSVCARFEVITAVLLKIQVLWCVTLCCWVCSLNHLKGALSLWAILGICLWTILISSHPCLSLPSGLLPLGLLSETLYTFLPHAYYITAFLVSSPY